MVGGVSKRKAKMKIIDESELTTVVVCKERSYIIPLDVRRVLDGQADAIREALEWLDKHAAGKAREVLMEALKQ